jgi:hypothetical protein
VSSVLQRCAMQHPQSCESMSNTGDTLQQWVRYTMNLRYFMVVLSLLVIACVSDAHVATAFAGDQATVETTCGVGLPTLSRDASPSVLQSVEPMPSPLSHIASALLHVQGRSPSTFEQSLFPNGNGHQDQLHNLVHVFLF